jgi:hypothetical protein
VEFLLEIYLESLPFLSSYREPLKKEETNPSVFFGVVIEGVVPSSTFPGVIDFTATTYYTSSTNFY